MTFRKLKQTNAFALYAVLFVARYVIELQIGPSVQYVSCTSHDVHILYTESVPSD